MKKVFLLVFVFSFVLAMAQTPQAVSYQTIVRDVTGEPITNRSVNVIFRIVQGNINGTEVYAEQQKPQTNEFGLMTVQIGRGLPLTGIFSSINWSSSPLFIRIEIDVNGGNNHVFMGASELLSVPYAQYAQKAATAEDDFDKDPNNELQTLSISGNSISISAGNSINLPSGTIDTDEQNLTLNGNTLEIDRGNSVDLSSFLDNTDAQNLSVSGNQLSISNGNSITLPTGFSGNYNDLIGTPNNLSDFTNDLGFITNPNDADSDPTNELQTLNFNSGTGELNISGGNSIVLPISTGGDNWGSQVVVSNTTLSGNGTSSSPLSVNGILTDNQTLSISGNVIAISGGNNITLPTGFSGNYNDLTNTPDNLSDFTNDLGFITNPNDADSDPTNELQNLSLSGSNLSISNGNSVNISTINTDNQTLSISGNTIAISGGNSINLPSGTVDTDEQNLTLNGNTLEIERGNSVDLSQFLDNTDVQTLSLSGNQLSITNGNSVTLPTGTTYSAGTGININGSNQIINTAPDQTVTISGSGATSVSGTYPNFTISSTDNVNDADSDPTNEIQELEFTSGILSLTRSTSFVDISSINTDEQTLSLSGNTLSISGGNSVSLPTGTTYTAGTGISIAGNVISNTGDLSSTNEIQTLAISGNTLSISGSNSITLPTVAQSLDIAYDGGRTIAADAGAVRINGTDGFIITGTHNNGAEIEVSGSGTRMFFNPRRVAFRAGRVSDNRWDADSLGSYSAAFGFNTKATGDDSFASGRQAKATNNGAVAFGVNTTASGINSFVGGSDALASGANSFSFGEATWAEGLNSVAFNSLTQASGWASTSMGSYTNANGYASLVIGTYNDTIVAAQGGTTSNTPLFIVGNGTFSMRKNAMVVLFNGNSGLNTNVPLSTLEVNGGFATTISTQSGSGSVTLNNNAAVWYFTGTASVTLPTASTVTNRRYIIVNRSASARTISSYTSLAGFATTSIPNNSSIEIISNGTSWLQIR